MSVVTLLDGPAAGEYALRRAPVFLRAVVAANGKRDVLDLLDDTPRPDETVHVYRAVPGTNSMPPDSMFICVRDGNGGYRQATGVASGEYHWLPDVDGGTVRATAAWRAWVKEQV